MIPVCKDSYKSHICLLHFNIIAQWRTDSRGQCCLRAGTSLRVKPFKRVNPEHPTLISPRWDHMKSFKNSKRDHTRFFSHLRIFPPHEFNPLVFCLCESFIESNAFMCGFNMKMWVWCSTVKLNNQSTEVQYLL